MADLVTHLAVALIPGVAFRLHHAALLALGAAFPDFGRVPGLVADAVVRWVAVPEWVVTPLSVLHHPVGAVLSCALLAQTLEDRRIGLVLLLAGATSHFVLDVAQDHHGMGYPLLAPFSYARFELGWIGSEATVDLAPWLGGLTVGLWLGKLVLARRNRR